MGANEWTGKLLKLAQDLRLKQFISTGNGVDDIKVNVDGPLVAS